MNRETLIHDIKTLKFEILQEESKKRLILKDLKAKNTILKRLRAKVLNLAFLLDNLKED